jgi:(p)ppGpp synthase/HD superfamily hydrolase
MEVNEEFLAKIELLAMFAHYGQFRNDGVTPYITHPVAVSELVEGYCEQYKVNFDATEASAVALLHDVIEDADIPLFDILSSEWNLYPSLYEHIYRLSHKSKRHAGMAYPHKHECWRRLLCGSRLVMLVKVCDRLHNTKDFAKFNFDKQKRIREETIEYIVPLARVLDEAYGSDLENRLRKNVDG